MLEKRIADPDRSRADLGFDQEEGEATAEGDHAENEEQRDRRPELPADQRPRKEKDDDKANEDRGKDGEPDRPPDQRHSAIERPDFAQQLVVLGAAALKQRRFDVPGSVDDPGQSSRTDVEESAYAGKEEHRREHGLDEEVVRAVFWKLIASARRAQHGP